MTELSDFVAETGSDIEHAEAGSFLATAARLAHALSAAGARPASATRS